MADEMKVLGLMLMRFLVSFIMLVMCADDQNRFCFATSRFHSAADKHLRRSKSLNLNF